MGTGYLNPLIRDHSQFREFRTDYMDAAFICLDAVIEAAERDLKDRDFDTIVGTGLSGALVVPALAMWMGKRFVIVRRPNDGSHHNDDDGGVLVGRLGRRWIFVDDFTSSGETYRRVRHAVDAGASDYDTTGVVFATEHVGNYYYTRRMWRDPLT